MQQHLKNAAMLVALVMTSSCAGVMKELGVGPKRNASNEVSSAIKARDVSRLTALCDDETLGSVEREPRHAACAELVAIKSNEDTGDCSTVVERSRSAKMTRADLDAPVDFSSRWAARLAKCEKYDEIFEQFAHLGEGRDTSTGVQVLQRLERDGVPLFAAFGRYAREHAGPSFLNVKAASYAGSHIGAWLLLAGRRDQCSVLLKALNDAPEGVRVGLLFYFEEAGCKAEGTAVALSLLAAKKDTSRVRSCASLGKLGATTAQPQLQLLADSDSFFVVRETVTNGRVYGVKVFPVRDACRDALTSLKLQPARK